MSAKKIEVGDMRRNVQSVFLMAMKEGYASDHPKKDVLSGLPGSRHIVFETVRDRYEWKVTDTYIVTPLSEVSSGMTIVACEGTPVWCMQYLGIYSDESLPFLKEALVQNYLIDKWHGGRGPEYYQNDAGWHYSNRVGDMRMCGYTRFLGEERVIDPRGEMAGYHSYQGIWMI